MTEAGFKDEDHLQRLLYGNPSLIPFADLGEGRPEPRAFVREAGLPGSGNTDLIGVDEQGHITIIECKLATNPEQKRKVVGQVLEYAAFLWQMSYDEFERRFAKELQAAAKVDLAALVAAGVADWSEGDFRAGVASSLAAGDFTLIIAVDSLNDELRRTIEYLNRRPGAGTTICAVEMGYFQSDTHEVVAPRLLGPAGTVPPPPTWDEAAFFERADRDCPEAVPVLRRLYEFSRRESPGFRWGRGKNGAFIFDLTATAPSCALFAAYTDGSIWLTLAKVREQLPEAAFAQFASDLSGISGFAKLPERLQTVGSPVYEIGQAFREPTDLDAFEAAVLRLRDTVGR